MLNNLRKFAVAYFVAFGGLLLTCLSSWNVRQELETSHLKEFQWAAGDRIQSVRAVVDQGLDALLEIRGLFYAAQGVDEQEFLVFTESILKRRPYINGLLWAPLLAAPRPAVDGLPAKPAPEQSGEVAAAARRDPSVEVPVRLWVGRDGAGALRPGVDLNADGELAVLFAQARASGQVSVSGRIEQARQGGAPYVFYAVLPVYGRNDPQFRSNNGKRGEPTGFIVGVYKVEELVHFAISLLEPRGVEVLVRDDSASEHAQFLHFYASRLEPRSLPADGYRLPAKDEDQPRLAVGIPVGDRQWSVICVATHTFRSAEAFTKAHWSVLIGGLFCTALLVLYLVRSRRELDDRIKLTQTIFEREELFRQLAETVDVVFWATNAEATRLEYIGPAFRQIVGPAVRVDEGNPALILEVFAPPDQRALIDAIARLRAEGGRFTVILPILRADRGVRWLRVCGFPVREAGCELSRIVGFFEDITEHKRAEDALRDSEAKLRTLFNHSPDLIFTVDAEAVILFTNRPLPYPGGAAGEKHSELFLPPDVRADYLQRLGQVFASGRIEHFQYRSDDSTWWEIRMVPISSADEVMAAMVVVTDITENRKLQWQAIRSSRLASLGVLSAGIAHEINNPNHAILANSSLLARIWHDAVPILDEFEAEQGSFLLAGLTYQQARETIARGMADIGENAKRIQKIIGNLKHLGKQDRGHMDELADLCKVLQAVVTLLDSRIRKHTDDFRLDLPERLPPVRGNVQQLEQVFINVIVNALESLPERSRSVRISASEERDAGRVVVHVADQGRGIADDVLAQIGEPFFTTKAESGGTGLGVSISSSIVEKHGGVLRFAANRDKGTTVTIDLPVAKEE